MRAHVATLFTLYALLTLPVVLVPSYADDKPTKDVPSVRFPEQVTPSPAPAPQPAGSLTADRLYIIDSDVDGFLLTQPSGLVSVTQDEGPLKIRGKFIDGSGATETRTYKGKKVFTIEASGVGTLYLNFVPKGVTLQVDIVSRTIQVDNGQGPRPPPDPPTPPLPPQPPVPPAPIPGDGLRVLIVYDGNALLSMPPEQALILTSKKVADVLNSKCAIGPDGKTKEWRNYSADAPLDKDFKVWQDAMKRPRTSLPWTIISNGKTGYEGPLSKNQDEFIALVNKYAP